MSTNIRIKGLSNTIRIRIRAISPVRIYKYKYISTNIFRYSFIDFWTTEYIQIFVCKFLEIQTYLNICSTSYFNICLSIFNEKVYLDIIYALQNIQCRI